MSFNAAQKLDHIRPICISISRCAKKRFLLEIYVGHQLRLELVQLSVDQSKKP